MSTQGNLSKTEPVLATSTITAVAAAVIGCLVAFGLDLSKDQIAAVLLLVGVLAPIVSGIVSRAKVTPNGKVVAFLPDPAVAGPVAGDAMPTAETGTPVTVVTEGRAA